MEKCLKKVVLQIGTREELREGTVRAQAEKVMEKIGDWHPKCSCQCSHPVKEKTGRHSLRESPGKDQMPR